MYNKVFLIGRLGKDPEFRTTQSGLATCKFTLATDEVRKSESGERITTTEWHRVVVWRRLAEIARDYLRKGSLVHIEGKIHYDSYENREGQKVYTTEIIADQFKMLDSRQDAQTRPHEARQATQRPQTAQTTGGGNDEDLPF